MKDKKWREKDEQTVEEVGVSAQNMGVEPKFSLWKIWGPLDFEVLGEEVALSAIGAFSVSWWQVHHSHESD